MLSWMWYNSTTTMTFYNYSMFWQVCQEGCKSHLSSFVNHFRKCSLDPNSIKNCGTFILTYPCWHIFQHCIWQLLLTSCYKIRRTTYLHIFIRHAQITLQWSSVSRIQYCIKWPTKNGYGKEENYKVKSFNMIQFFLTNKANHSRKSVGQYSMLRHNK